jgi:DNA-binding winged helix-turn-helix (wHTH) protein/tetratricopeptide (TPR) repeat protein
MKYQFSNILINTINHELTVDGKVIDIEPQTFDLLLYLIENQGKTVTRDQLIETVWKGRIVSDTTISSAVKVARKCIGDNGKAQKFIKTIHGRGFQFIHDVNVINATAQSQTQAAGSITKTMSEEADIPSHISLLILPFQIQPDIDCGEILVSSLVRDIENILTRISLLNISSESSRYTQQAIRPTGRQIYEDIGVMYLIDGSIRQYDSSIDVNVHLTDNISGFKIWSSNFRYQHNSSETTDSLINQMMLDIVAHVEPQLNRSIVQKITNSRAPRNSRSLYLEANGLLSIKGWREETFREAIELLEESSSLDPNFPLSPALQSLLLAFGLRVGLLDNREQDIKEALVAAAHALKLDSRDSTVLGFVGCAYCDINMLDRGLPLLKNAIKINPANGQAWAALGAAQLLQRDLGSALKNLEHGIQISPLDNRVAVWRSILAMTFLLNNQVDKATEHALTACEEDVNLYMPRVVLAGIRMKQKKVEQSHTALNEAYSVKPDLRESEIQGLVGQKLTNLLLEMNQTPA